MRPEGSFRFGLVLAAGLTVGFRQAFQIVRGQQLASPPSSCNKHLV